MIKTEGLCKVFARTVNNEKNKKKKEKEDFYAVNNVNITADHGEILGILGPNGAGKTTLLRMMGHLMVPTAGSVTIEDENGIVSSDVEIKKRIGYLSGNTKLYHRFSIREMLHTLCEVYGITKADADKKIEEIIDILKLQDFVDNKIEKLSTGQTQRANIARCLVHSPDIYIFDEPTLGLDIISSEAIIEFMKSEKEKGKTILYSTHYMEEAAFLCDRIVFMHNGKVLDLGTPAELMEKTGTNNLRDTFKAEINNIAGEEE